MTKLDDLRRLREARAAGGKRSKPVKRPKVAGKPKARPKPTVEVKAVKVRSRPPAPRIGRPPTGFDRAAYQRVYVPLRRKYGPLKMWPPEAVALLNSVRSAKPKET